MKNKNEEKLETPKRPRGRPRKTKPEEKGTTIPVPEVKSTIEALITRLPDLSILEDENLNKPNLNSLEEFKVKLIDIITERNEAIATQLSYLKNYKRVNKLIDA